MNDGFAHTPSSIHVAGMFLGEVVPAFLLTVMHHIIVVDNVDSSVRTLVRDLCILSFCYLYFCDEFLKPS